MEKLKRIISTPINYIIKISPVIIAVSLLMIAMEYTSKKSWSFEYANNLIGSYSSIEKCIKEESYYRAYSEINLKFNSCEYR